MKKIKRSIKYLLPLSVAILLAASCVKEKEGSTVTSGGDFAKEDIVPGETVSAPAKDDSRVREVDGAEMVYAPVGEFTMGSDGEEVDFALAQCRDYDINCNLRYFSIEQPPHTVTLDGFWIDKTEVTNGQFAKCVQAGHCQVSGCIEESQAENRPVVCVSWEQAANYCEWAGGRLPTEAEWEYAARGPEGSRYPWGDEFDGTKANYCDSSCQLPKSDGSTDDGYAAAAPVGSYPDGSSWIGALDMAGNVWEWTADFYGPYTAEPQVNPVGPMSGGRRVVRGGSWHASPDHLRSALRSYAGAGQSINHAGFRCVWDTN